MNPLPRGNTGISTPHSQVLTRETKVPSSVEIPMPKMVVLQHSCKHDNVGESHDGLRRKERLSQAEPMFPLYELQLAWNLVDEILQQQKKYRRRGGHVIMPVPGLGSFNFARLGIATGLHYIAI
jgi:hypothetical protein